MISTTRTALALGTLALAFIACRSDATSRKGGVAMADEVMTPAPMEPGSGTAYEASARYELPDTSPEDHPDLHNVYDLSANIISGSEPHGEEAFRILRDRGVHTVLSVDGKVPDAETAARYGIKYVHVPIQYKGITEDEVAKITKTFREQEGPFYVHCFHGKHRGPAAAEIGRLVLDGIPREEALAEMRRCGTSPAYEGLYATIAYTDIPSEGETRAIDWDFPAAQELEGVAGTMVEITRASDHLKAASKNGWRPPASHPDLNAPNEAAKLASLFERTAAMDEIASRPEDFRRWLADAERQSAELRDVVAALDGGSATAEAADAAFKTLSRTCGTCHEAYRN